MAECAVVFGGFSFGQAAENHEDHDDEATASPKQPNMAAFRRRITVSAEVYDKEKDKAFVPQKFAKKPAEVEAITKVLESHYLFRHLDDRELANLVEMFEPKQYKTGESLDEDAANAQTSFFHVITQGECEVQADGAEAQKLGAGSTCGETDMMYTKSQTDKIVALSDLHTFCIDRRTYQRTLQSTFAEKRKLYCDCLKNVKFLEGLSRKEMVQLADCLEACKFKEGEILIHCHAPPDAMYIIIEGIVKVIGRDEKNQKIDVCEFTKGAIVGELEFLHDHNNVADVVAKSSEVRAARLDRKHFELCMGPLKDLIKSSRKEDPVYDYYRQTRAKTGDHAKDPEAGVVIEVNPNRLPYTYAGHIKSMMKEGEARVTLKAMGRATETAIATANRLTESKLVTVKKVATFLSDKGLPGLRVLLEKVPDFDSLLKDADAKEAAAKDAEAES